MQAQYLLIKTYFDVNQFKKIDQISVCFVDHV
jgi:hypothetical protein